MRVPKNYFPIKQRITGLALKLAQTITEATYEVAPPLTNVEVMSALSDLLDSRVGESVRELIEGDEEIYEIKD